MGHVVLQNRPHYNTKEPRIKCLLKDEDLKALAIEQLRAMKDKDRYPATFRTWIKEALLPQIQQKQGWPAAWATKTNVSLNTARSNPKTILQTMAHLLPMHYEKKL